MTAKKAPFQRDDLVVIKGHDVQYAAVVLPGGDANSTPVKLDDDRVWRVSNGLLRKVDVEEHDRVRVAAFPVQTKGRRS